MSYRVEYTTNAARGVRKLPPAAQIRVLDRAGGLAAEPRPSGCKKLSGPVALWRVRAGDYRIVYTVDDDSKVVTVTRVGHRSDVYR